MFEVTSVDFKTRTFEAVTVGAGLHSSYTHGELSPEIKSSLRLEPTPETASVIRRRWVRILSWLVVDPALQSEALYIEADRFFHQKVLLVIWRRTIYSHSDPC